MVFIFTLWKHHEAGHIFQSAQANELHRIFTYWNSIHKLQASTKIEASTTVLEISPANTRVEYQFRNAAEHFP